MAAANQFIRNQIQHQLTFGAPRSTAHPTRVRKEDFTLSTLKDPEKPMSFDWNAVVPRSDVTRLLNGFIPVEIEQKWFIYSDGPNDDGRAVVHMHRRASGRQIIELEVLLPLDEKQGFANRDAKISRITAEAGEDQNFDNSEVVEGKKLEEKAKGLVIGICAWVLNVILR